MVWSGVYSATRMHTTKKWDGSKHVAGVYEKRAAAVEWGRERPVYNTRRDGKQGAWLYDEFVATFRIDLPNWDFNPEAPIEVIEAERQAA